MSSAENPIRLAIVDDHKMLLGALTEWIRGAATDIRMVAAVPTWPELLTHSEFPVDVEPATWQHLSRAGRYVDTTTPSALMVVIECTVDSPIDH